jgi:hypothetical protein
MERKIAGGYRGSPWLVFRLPWRSSWFPPELYPPRQHFNDIDCDFGSQSEQGKHLELEAVKWGLQRLHHTNRGHQDATKDYPQSRGKAKGLWACGNNQQTFSYRPFFATWAKRLSWKETASIFGTSWDSVFRAIQWVVHWGIVHRDLTGIESIGIDEIQYSTMPTSAYR